MNLALMIIILLIGWVVYAIYLDPITFLVLPILFGLLCLLVVTYPNVILYTVGPLFVFGVIFHDSEKYQEKEKIEAEARALRWKLWQERAEKENGRMKELLPEILKDRERERKRWWKR